MFDCQPPNLHPLAVHIWDWYAANLPNAEIYPASVAPQFAQLCMYEAFLAQHDLLSMPLSLETDTGARLPNPDLLMYDKIMARVQVLWARLALDPMFLWQSAPMLNMVQESPVKIYIPNNHRDREPNQPPADPKLLQRY